jgi:glutamate transport system substrate-binding protein
VSSTRLRWLLVALATFAALVLVACGDDEEESGGEGGGGDAAADVKQFPADSALGRIQEEGKITIGVKYDVPPFGFRNPQSDEIEGFDVDMGRHIADALGVEPEFIEAISDNRIPFLMRDRADLILSTMTITGERDTEIDFSEPYYIARGRILVPGDSQIKGIADLDGDTSVCTALGSTYEETLKKEAPDSDLRLVDSYPECLELLQNGAVDAISTDDVILTGMIIQDDTLKLVGDNLTTEPYGVGIKQGNRQMKQFVDETLQAVKDDGRWEDSYQEWVGQYTDQQQKPPTMTLEEAVELAPE